MIHILSGTIAGVNSSCRGTQVYTSLRKTERALLFSSFLFRRGWISGYRIINNAVIELSYKYNKNRGALHRIQLLSKPGARLFITYKKLSRFCSGPHSNAVLVLDTTKGFLSSTEALSMRLGGELIARISE